MRWNWIGKWLKRRHTVYKVVCNDWYNHRLISAVIGGEFQRVYRRHDGYCPVVRQAMAFETLAAARAFARRRGYLQVWKARCEQARRLRRLCDICDPRSLLRCFSRRWGEPNGWGAGMKAPAGTLLCKNLQLIERVED